jgi:hypothetical protein
MLLHVQNSHLRTLPASPRCESCFFLGDCGGMDADTSLFNCLDVFCCGGQHCDEVCPNNRDFANQLTEVRGLSARNVRRIGQIDIALPTYIPHAIHHYCRNNELDSTWISLSPYQLMREVANKCTLCVSDAAALRTMFKLRANAMIVLRGIDADPPLERYWAFRRRDHLPEQFKQLGIALFIGPNYSHFSDVPRTQNLFNRKRQLLCLSEMTDAGLNVSPHLNATMKGDWNFWRSYLQDNPQITLVAKEFQTGCRGYAQGVEAICEIDRIQQALGRELHLIAIGGAQFTEQVAARFRRFSVLDVVPYINGVHRYRFIPKGKRGRRVLEMYLPGFGVDKLVNENIEAYSAWIEHRARLAAGRRHLADRHAS